MATATAGRVAAALVVGGVAVSLAVPPVFVGFGLAPAAEGRLVGGLAGLVAIACGVKLAAVTWGLAVRFSTAPGPQIASASVD